MIVLDMVPSLMLTDAHLLGSSRLFIYLFICLFVSSLFIDGPQGYDAKSPFAHMGK